MGLKSLKAIALGFFVNLLYWWWLAHFAKLFIDEEILKALERPSFCKKIEEFL